MLIFIYICAPGFLESFEVKHLAIYTYTIVRHFLKTFLKIFYFIYLSFGCIGSSLLGLFSSCGERGLLLVAVCGLLICGGFSCCGARALGAWASVVVARGLSSCGSLALECRLSSCDAWA